MARWLISYCAAIDNVSLQSQLCSIAWEYVNSVWQICILNASECSITHCTFATFIHYIHSLHSPHSPPISSIKHCSSNTRRLWYFHILGRISCSTYGLISIYRRVSDLYRFIAWSTSCLYTHAIAQKLGSRIARIQIVQILLVIRPFACSLHPRLPVERGRALCVTGHTSSVAPIFLKTYTRHSTRNFTRYSKFCTPRSPLSTAHHSISTIQYPPFTAPSLLNPIRSDLNVDFSKIKLHRFNYLL